MCLGFLVQDLINNKETCYSFELDVDRVFIKLTTVNWILSDAYLTAIPFKNCLKGLIVGRASSAVGSVMT
jgi:hypothetical protein